MPFGYKPVKENFGLLFDVGVFADSHAEKVRVVDLLAAHYRFVAVTVARIAVFFVGGNGRDRPFLIRLAHEFCDLIEVGNALDSHGEFARNEISGRAFVSLDFGRERRNPVFRILVGREFGKTRKGRFHGRKFGKNAVFYRLFHFVRGGNGYAADRKSAVAFRRYLLALAYRDFVDKFERIADCVRFTRFRTGKSSARYDIVSRRIGKRELIVEVARYVHDTVAAHAPAVTEPPLGVKSVVGGLRWCFCT